MTSSERIMWVVVILLADLLVFVVPIAAATLAYALIARPIWFKEWIDRIYAE